MPWRSGWSRRLVKTKRDRAWGIERNPSSAAFGEQVLGGEGQMPIILWSRPGCVAAAENVTGAVKHGQTVELMRKVQYRDEMWWRVRTAVVHKGKKHMQRGWIKQTLLRREGNGQRD